MNKEIPLMYTDMSERAFILWNLDYTMDRVIETFVAIPDGWLSKRTRPNIPPAGWTFGHIAVTERVHVGRYLEGIDDIPSEFNIFYPVPPPVVIPSEAELAKVIKSKDQLINYWRHVRQQTTDYLKNITDADLKTIPKKTLHPKDLPNSSNPIREWFVMTIQHQNYNWGRLEIVKRLITDQD